MGSLINSKTEKIAILDETKSQNVPNISRILYEPGTKNIITKPPVKFGINVIGFQGCERIIMITGSNKIKEWLNSPKVKKQIKEAINNPNLEIEEIQAILYNNQLSNKDLINKINNELYNENSKQISIKKYKKSVEKKISIIQEK